MKQEKVHDFFHNVSRITIILPIIIIALGVILKSSAPNTLQVQNAQIAAQPTVAPTMYISPTSIPINLTGPLVCTFDSQSDYPGTLFIKNKNVFARLLPKGEEATISVLLKDDCVYKWENKATTGAKICSVSQYITMINMLSSFNLLDAESLMNIITQFGQANGAKNMPEKAPAATCLKEMMADSIFDLPKNIQFQLKTTPVPSPKIKQ